MTHEELEVLGFLCELFMWAMVGGGVGYLVAAALEYFWGNF